MIHGILKGRTLLSISILMVLSGCAGYHPAMESPPVEIPSEFSISGNMTAPVLWWQAFKDRQLMELEGRALTANMDVLSAWIRIEQAEAAARKAGAELYPWIDVSAGASHQTSRNGNRYENTDTLSLGAVASYELDLWGRIRKGREAAEMNVLAAEADLDTARITLSAELALAYFELQGTAMQLHVIQRQIKENLASLDIISAMYEYGQTDIIDTLQQKQAVESTKAQEIEKKKSIDLLKNQLAVLLGCSPGTIHIRQDAGLPSIPPLPDTGVPLDIVNRRPDCRSAFFRLKAANARLAQAVAEQYPRISLSASADTSASSTGDLFENWLATLAANILTPVFEGGRLKAGVEQAQAEARQALYDYGSTVLTAIREVEDALAREARQREILDNMEKRLELSRRSMEQITEQYKAGTVEFLRFLATELSTDTLETKVITEKLKLVEARIALYRAMAGPITVPSPASQDQGIRSNQESQE